MRTHAWRVLANMVIVPDWSHDSADEVVGYGPSACGILPDYRSGNMSKDCNGSWVTSDVAENNSAEVATACDPE